jgi:hypothetical protein
MEGGEVVVSKKEISVRPKRKKEGNNEMTLRYGK